MNEIMSEEVVAAVMMDRPRVAVILPCYNEEAAIAQTVHSFREALPHADIYVYDNNSGDRTREIAEAAGAVVRTERMQGRAMSFAACSPMWRQTALSWREIGRETCRERVGRCG